VNTFDGGLAFSEMSLLGKSEIILGLVVEEHGKLSLIIDIEEHAFVLIDDGSGDHITGTESLIVLLVCEDILGSDHGLGGSVLAGLGSRESGDLAGESLFHDDERAGLHAASVSELSDIGT